MLESEMVLSESMKNSLRQICIYAFVAGIDVEELKNDLEKRGKIPCESKNESKKILSEIYDHVACSF